MGPRVVVLIIIVWHLTFLLSIVDLYFRSPVLSGAAESCAPQPAAQRVVFFVADGLRADAFFETSAETGRHRAPFLRQKFERDGVFGVSHTRVPTESRPGHVALLAGIYEDVSAVTRGWKSNPVQFDSIFNHTYHSFGLGSPDIVPMFGDGLPPKRMTVHCYGAEQEDFAAADAAATLDSWVFDRWQSAVLNNESIRELVDAPKTLHFLHLLGIDTNGHAFRPASRQYLNNIASVDAGVERMVEVMERRFPDKQTAYVFTADHGMSDKGSHGAGDPSETETPLVAWGAGIRGPRASSGKGMESPRGWEVDHLLRRDLAQADITPFLAALLGVAVPANSVGLVPDDLFLELDRNRMHCNAMQLVELLRLKHSRAEASALWFRPSSALADASRLLELDAVTAAETARNGLRYYDAYDRPFLYCVLSIALWGWLLVLSSRFSSLAPLAPPSYFFRGAQGVLMGIASLGLFITKSPIPYYAYVGFAILWATEAVRELPRFRKLVTVTASPLLLIGALLMTEAIVLGFFWRPVFSILLLIMALVALFAWKQSVWAVSLALIAVFPLISPNYGTDQMLQLMGGLLSAGLILYARGGTFGAVLVAIAAANSLVVHSYLVSWILLPLSLFSYVYYHRGGGVQLFSNPGSVFALFAPTYILLSVSYESIFLVVLSVVLVGWVRAERYLHQTSHASHYLRGALLYLVFTYLSFFGTGNTGSLSSFEISSTYRFVSVFSPFLMGLLLLIKVVIPFILVGVAFAWINAEHRMAEERVFVSVLALSNVMAYTFFFLVKDEGSWREIGVSISHFVMSNAQIVAFIILMQVPKLLGVAPSKLSD